jgi:selenocysteine-specific elongation factor
MRTGLTIVLAGHIDHGKTTLVRALTGIDTDRLEEEKRRGMTIELGFAPWHLPDGRWVSFVDVPGHERLVHTMIAGAAGVDAVLLVIAADEGVMPQTVEHAEVCRLLGIREGIVALTKIDRVEDEWRVLVAETIREWLTGLGWSHFPIVEVSALRGDGLDRLRQALVDLLDRLPVPAPVQAPRIAVDRVFSLAGVGTIVTGTMEGAPFRVRQTVMVYPKGQTATIRSIHVHERSVPEAVSGSRTALNLQGVHHTELARGDWVAEPGRMTVDRAWYAWVRWLPEAARWRKPRSVMRFHFHHGAAAHVARLFWVGPSPAQWPETALVRLVFAGPVAGNAGDAFVLRTLSPTRAVGGGQLIEPVGRRTRRRERAVAAAWRDWPDLSPGARLETYVELHGLMGVAWSDLQAWTGWTDEALRRYLAPLIEAGRLVVDRWPEATFVTTAQAVQTAWERARKVLAEYHTRHPLRSGMPRETWIQQWCPQAHPFWYGVVASWVQEGRIVQDDDEVRLADFRVVLPPDLAEAVQALRTEIAQRPWEGLRWPDVRDRALQMGLDPEDLLVYLRKSADVLALEMEGVLHLVDADCGRQFRQLLERLAEGRAYVTVSDIKQAMGWSRKWTIAWLEFAARQQWTHRVGDQHYVRRTSERGPGDSASVPEA